MTPRRTPRPTFIEWAAGCPYPISSLRRQRRCSRSPRRRVDVSVHVQTSESDCDSDTSSPVPSSGEKCSLGERKQVHFEDSTKLVSKKALKGPKNNKAANEDSETSSKCTVCWKAAGEGGKSQEQSNGQHSTAQKSNSQPKKIDKQGKKDQPTAKDKNSNQDRGKNSHKSEPTSQVDNDVQNTRNQGNKQSSTIRFSTKSPLHSAQIMSNRILRSARAEVVEREDVIEEPSDPRPNAYFDSNSGILRVYHGNVYGNPYASLFPTSSSSIPVGTFRQTQIPYFYGIQQPQFSMLPYGALPAAPQAHPNFPFGNFGDQPASRSRGEPPSSVDGQHAAQSWSGSKVELQRRNNSDKNGNSMNQSVGNNVNWSNNNDTGGWRSSNNQVNEDTGNTGWTNFNDDTDKQSRSNAKSDCSDGNNEWHATKTGDHSNEQSNDKSNNQSGGWGNEYGGSGKDAFESSWGSSQAQTNVQSGGGDSTEDTWGNQSTAQTWGDDTWGSGGVRDGGGGGAVQDAWGGGGGW